MTDIITVTLHQNLYLNLAQTHNVKNLYQKYRLTKQSIEKQFSLDLYQYRFI